jgi:hypothetical protein
MVTRKSAGFSFIGIIFMIMGIKVQRPVRKIKRGRSFKYKVFCKMIAGSGNKGRRKTTRRRR